MERISPVEYQHLPPTGGKEACTWAEGDPMPDPVPVIECVCFGGACGPCGVTERALRGWNAQLRDMPAMTPEQQAWCRDQVRACGDSTTQRGIEDPMPDGVLAGWVLMAWQDYARDKGVI